jgi:hypothetical protein
MHYSPLMLVIDMKYKEVTPVELIHWDYLELDKPYSETYSMYLVFEEQLLVPMHRPID